MRFQACDSCRQLKAKCDETKPCKSCKEKKLECKYRDPAPKASVAPSLSSCLSSPSYSAEWIDDFSDMAK